MVELLQVIAILLLSWNSLSVTYALSPSLTNRNGHHHHDPQNMHRNGHNHQPCIDDSEHHHHPSRRKFLAKSSSSVSGVVVVATTISSCTVSLFGMDSTNSIASAVAPITPSQMDNGWVQLDRQWIRPKPVLVASMLRPRLYLNFAILLMRCSYNAIDALNIIAMNQFQRDFFLIRSAEYEPYIQQLRSSSTASMTSPILVQQGDLTDPYYFDFISLAQYRTINRAIADPSMIFEEMKPIEETNDTDIQSPPLQRFEKVIVQRTMTSDQLIPEFDKMVGNAILQYMDDTYGDTASRILPVLPINNHRQEKIVVTEDVAMTALQQLVNIFVINGFAGQGTVECRPSMVSSSTDKKSKTTTNNNNNIATRIVPFVLTMQFPATAWSGTVLTRNRSTMLHNDFLRKAAQQFCMERLGCPVVSTSVQYQNNKEVTVLSVLLGD